jgi:hypothetical protein
MHDDDTLHDGDHDTLHEASEPAYAPERDDLGRLPGSVTEQTEVGALPHLLARDGLRLASLTVEGREYVARLTITTEAAIDRRLDFAQGRGPGIASAIEDAREGWILYRAMRLSGR